MKRTGHIPAGQIPFAINRKDKQGPIRCILAGEGLKPLKDIHDILHALDSRS